MAWTWWRRLKGREAALASPKSKSPLPRVVNYQRRAGFLCNLTDLVTLHFHNCVFLAHKAGQVRHRLQEFVTFAVSLLSTARCLHCCVLRPTKAYQHALQVVQCFLKEAYYLAVCSARWLCNLHMLYCRAQGAHERSTCLWTRHQGQRNCDGKLMPMSFQVDWISCLRVL